MVLIVFFEVLDRRLEAPESKLANLVAALHVPAPRISGAVLGAAILVFLIWFGLATVRRRHGKAVVNRLTEPLVALAGTAALWGLGWVMVHRPSREFYTIIWGLLCVGLFTGQMRKRDPGVWRAALAVLPLSVLGGYAVYRVIPEGYSWAKEIAMMLLVWTGLIGASMAMHQGRHIDIDFGKKIFPKGWRMPLTVLASLITAAFCTLLVAIGVVYVFGARGLYKLEGHMQHTGLPDWILGLAIPWAFLVMGLRALLVARRVIGGAVDAKGSCPTAAAKGLGEH